MRVTIIPEDNKVAVEGYMYEVDCASLMERNIHAVQWYSSFGEIEYATDLQTGHRAPNERIEDITQFQPLLDAWEAEAQADTTPAPMVPSAS